jgi:hypothetical protein
MLKSIPIFAKCLVDKEMMPTAIKVSLVVGSLLLMINHGIALIKGEMNRDRVLSACLTYLVPYCVNIHGQCVSRQTKR